MLPTPQTPTLASPPKAPQLELDLLELPQHRPSLSWQEQQLTEQGPRTKLDLVTFV